MTYNTGSELQVMILSSLSEGHELNDYKTAWDSELSLNYKLGDLWFRHGGCAGFHNF